MLRVPGLLALTLAACTLDSTNPTGTGSGGAPSGSSSGTTQPTTGASMETTGAAMTTAGTGGMSSSSDGSTSTSASSSDASSGMSSSSTGGPTNVPFCVAIQDDFNSYTADFDIGVTTDFVEAGEMNGPWAELTPPTHFNNTRWLDDGLGKHIRTHYGDGGPAALYLKNKLTLGLSGTCVVTVRLVRVTSGDLSAFGLVNDVVNPAQSATVECQEGNGGNCSALKAFGFNGVSVNVPVTLAILVKANNVFAFYDDGAGWTVVPGPAATGFPANTLLGGSSTVLFGQRTGDADSDWDDFNVPTFPSSMVP